MQCELNEGLNPANRAKPLFSDILTNKSIGESLNKIPPFLFDSDDYRYKIAEKQILEWGGMPALLPLSDEDRWQWLKNYGYTYLERDLADLARLDDLLPFRKFQRLAALRAGMLLNYSELARDTGISVDTARRYLEYLSLSYQTVLLQPFYRNLTSSTVKTPKLFWTDVGILRQLTGFRGEITGQIYENMVVGEMIKWIKTGQSEVDLYFYRTRSGREIDVLIETKNGLIGVEVKMRESTSGKDIRAMTEVAKVLGKSWLGGLVVYTGKEIRQIAEHDIWAVPSRRLFQPASQFIADS